MDRNFLNGFQILRSFEELSVVLNLIFKNYISSFERGRIHLGDLVVTERDPMKVFSNILGKILFKLTQKALSYLGFNIHLGAQPDYPELSESEVDFLFKVRGAQVTMTSFESTVALSIACKYLEKNFIPGDFVETGVWRGGSAIVAKYFLNNSRNIFLFDTFTGMTKPTSHDFRIGAKTNYETLSKWEKSKKPTHVDWVFASIEEVTKNFKKFGLLDDRVRFIKGDVTKTLKRGVPDQIALLRLDTDFYDSTLIALQVLYPLLITGGVLILDDYGHWDGARKAVDEYFAESVSIPLMIPIAGGGGRILIKQV